MRILLANTGHPDTIKGGAEAAALDLARRLAQRGHEVSLVVHHGGSCAEMREEASVRIHELPNRNLYFAFDGRQRPAPARLAWHLLDSANPFMSAAFGRVLDAEQPDIVNTHALAGLSPLVWLAAKRRQIPVVHYLHEYGALCPRSSGFRNGRTCTTSCTPCGIVAWPRKRLSGLVDTVVGVSRYTLQRHLDWGLFPNAISCVLPNVFEGLHFRGRKTRKDGCLRIGYFGRLIPDKGAHILLDAVKRLSSEGWTLDIAGVGDPAYVASLKAGAPANVRFLGWAKADDFFAGIDLMVLPSIWPDPQPRVTFEAYMHGVPVIGSRAGGIPEEIDEGETGWLFEAGSADALADLLQARLRDRADRDLPAEGFVRRLAALDPEQVAQEYETVYRNTIAAGQQSRTPADVPQAG